MCGEMTSNDRNFTGAALQVQCHSSLRETLAKSMSQQLQRKTEADIQLLTGRLTVSHRVFDDPVLLVTLKAQKNDFLPLAKLIELWERITHLQCRVKVAFSSRGAVYILLEEDPSRTTSLQTRINPHFGFLQHGDLVITAEQHEVHLFLALLILADLSGVSIVLRLNLVTNPSYYAQLPPMLTSSFTGINRLFMDPSRVLANQLPGLPFS